MSDPKLDTNSTDSNSHAQSTDIHENSINTADILEVAKLSRLAVDEKTAGQYAKDIDKILTMMQTISDVDTEGLTPLSNVHEVAHDLRADVPNTDINREQNQSVAPAVDKGLYLVPQVIE